MYALQTHPLVFVCEAAPVEHVHHSFKAEQRLLLVLCWQGQITSCKHCVLIFLCPCKLLQPHLQMPRQPVMWHSHMSYDI